MSTRASPSARSAALPSSGWLQSEPRSAARQAKLDRRVVHGGALGEQVRRVDADVARVAGQRPALVDGLDDVALLELREVGVRLRGVRRRIRLEDAAVAA